jgi:hypothetical protein
MMINYKKTLIITALTLGAGVLAHGQSAKFNLNGVGRSVLSNNEISGSLVDSDETIQKSGVAGYNLFDLQTNLAVDSSFQAMAVFRAYSPFGSFFGAATNFEFRQFKMHGKFNDFKYEIGDVRVEMTPYTVFNNYITDGTYESDIFKRRRDIMEYENFNKGNSWLLQGVAGEYFWKMSDEGMGLGVYAFGSRNTSTNEITTPDRLLAGGRLEFRINDNIKIGANAVSMFDISLLTSDFDYTNNVFTGDIGYKFENDAFIIDANVETGMSQYSYSYFEDQDTVIDQTDTAYDDGFVDVKVGFVLKKAKVRFDLNAKSVGVLFTSPSAQTRRIDVTTNPALLGTVQSGDRGQGLYDRSTAEEIYNSKITPTLQAFLPRYNNATPYGAATPNRNGGSFRVGTDTSLKSIDASAKLDFLQEIQGEGIADLRSFMVVSVGVNAHIGKLLKVKRAVDVNAGIRYENTNRGGNAPVEFTSMLVDAGFAVEILKKIDLLGGLKYLVAEGNEYTAHRDGFGLVSSFTAYDVNVNETIISAGARIRFSPFQSFVVNYNMTSFADELVTNSNYNLGQLFLNYTGRF